MTAKRLLIVLSAALALGLLSVSARNSAQSADDILSAAVARIAQAPAVEAQFTVQAGDGPVQGTILISGQKYAVATPAMSVWYDGHTQWTQMHSTTEVCISEPTADEVMESNPFAILSNYSRNFRCRRLADVDGRKRVELTPLSPDSDIRKAIITVGPDGWVAGAQIVYDDGRGVSAAVDRIGAVRQQPLSAFRYDRATHPASEIIDLR